MIRMVARKCRDTTHGLSLVSTVMPPMIACSGTPRAMPVARRRDRLSTGRYRMAATQVAIATATNTQVSRRLPNSMTPWMPISACGVYEPSVHCGQVGHPSPESVTRTAPPVTTSSTLAARSAIAQACRKRRLGTLKPNQLLKSEPPDREDAADDGPHQKNDDAEHVEGGIGGTGQGLGESARR